jgi:hypothetical protein
MLLCFSKYRSEIYVTGSISRNPQPVEAFCPCNLSMLFFHSTLLQRGLFTAATLLAGGLLMAQPARPDVPGCTVRYVHRYAVYPSLTGLGLPTPTDSVDSEVLLHRLQGRLRY